MSVAIAVLPLICLSFAAQEVDGMQDAPHVVAALFKRYLSMLPTSIFSAALLMQFEATVRALHDCSHALLTTVVNQTRR
jgi:hypothetical protein